jgi:NTP pyrophosphatase (non-canonical NTP hydrolase)
MDSNTNISSLKDKAVAFRDERDWKQFHTLKDLAMGLSIEAAELMELVLWKSGDEVALLLSKDEWRRRMGEELADIFIYLLYISNDCGIDLSESVVEKIKLNGKKYPVEKSRRSNRKYNEI